jgi:hypothetical protein
MTCHEMTERMLDAELDELSGIGGTPLALHVRRCIPCRTAARTIVAGTRRLAMDVLETDAPAIRAARSRSSRRRGLLVASVAAAAITLLLSSRGGEDTHPIALPATVAVVTRPAERPDATPLPRARPVPPAVRRPAPAQRASAPAPSTVAAAMGDDVPHVTVDVPTGKQAVVMRTANPLVTVVWIR